MKIIHLVLGKANPERMNGVNKLVYEMANTQAALGHEVTLWGITKSPVHDYPARDFNTRLFPATGNKFNVHHTIGKAISKLPETVVFHLHGSFIIEFYHIGKMLKKRNIPYVYTPHGALGPAALKRSAWKKKIYFALFEKSLIQNAAKVIATGKSVYENVGKLVPEVPRTTIPNGQPLADFAAPVFNKTDKLIFSYCGRIALEHKGLDLLLEGFRKFLDQGGEAELQLIGDGAEMPILKKQAERLNLEKNIVFHGARYGNEKFELLRKTHVFVHTSRMEGFPAAVLEAASIGLPCLVSTHTNVDDYIRDFDAGLVIENNIPEIIAKRMLEILAWYKKGLLEQKGKNAKGMIKSEFDWKHICEKLIEVYGQAVEEKMETIKA